MSTRRILAAMTIAACFGLFGSIAHARISNLPENQKLIDGYALTMENIRKVAKVVELAKATGDDQREMESDDEEKPLADQWREIERLDTKGLLRQAGISARDYLMTMTALMQATIDVELKEKPRSATNAANVAFLHKNRAEIERLLPQGG